MSKYILARFHWLLLTLALSLFVSSTAFGQATIVIQQGAGFNDPTPVAPVGGNDGTTLGQQRLNAFQFAASIWAATINSNVPIRVQASWEPRPCTATGGTGGSSSLGMAFRNFPGAPRQNTFFPQALANSLAGTDLDPGAADMGIILNVNLGTPDCFANTSWYLGFDGKGPTNSFDVVAGLLHEFGHGLGFTTFTNRSSGAQPSGFPSIYDTFLFDKVIGKTWPQMTDSERAFSATNTGNLVWNGPHVTADVPNVLGTPRLRINTPRAIAGDYLGAEAVFGALLASPGVTGNVVQALDPSDDVGPATTDGCSALTNAEAITGKIAIIDRGGTCFFVTKVKNAQDAGAIAVIIANNRSDPPDPPSLGGQDPTILITVLSLTQAGGNAIKAQPGGTVNATLFLDRSVPAGADSSNRPLLFTPATLAAGSSVIHSDPSLVPNPLMQPSLTPDQPQRVTPPRDLTFSLLRDLGWTGVAPAPPNVQLTSSNFSIGEAGTTLNVGVSRTGDTSGASTVEYTTSDTAGAHDCNLLNTLASSRCDYLTTLGKLTFAAGETSKTFSIPIIDDVYAEGGETFTITLSNVTGATLGTATATLTITDNESVNGTNPIDTTSFFVRQHYIDFLNREPDGPGLAFWSDQINSCGADPQCIEVKRINVSASFFLSIEFQETGYLVYRTYKSGFGDINPPTIVPVPVRFLDFLRDTQQIGRGFQFLAPGSEALLEANKVAYMLAFVQRADFLGAFPNTLTAGEFVDKLNLNAGGVLSPAERTDLINGMSSPANVAQRAAVFRAVAEDSDLKNAESNKAFVLMQYFGYLRRNPNDAPDPDFSGFYFWLAKLNQFNGNFVNAEMVKAFITSIEYRQRFAP
jgi:hypothetical protein